MREYSFAADRPVLHDLQLSRGRKCRERKLLKAKGCRTVLVVDDEPQVRSVVQQCLTEAGFEVRAAADGRQALEMMQSQPRPDAIVLDLLMPVMSGFEVLSALRIMPGWATIPVVVLSASTDYSAEHLGAAALLQKPFTAAALAAAVEGAIGSNRTAGCTRPD